jgi:hypothetical protein
VEAVLTQMLWLPSAPFEPTFYSGVIIHLLQSRDPGLQQHVGNVLGLAGRVLFKYAHAFDTTVLDRVAEWLAHHVSNVKWRFLWEEWANATATATASGSTDAQRRLLSACLKATFALVGPWHYDRIVANEFASLKGSGLLPKNATEACASMFLPPKAVSTGTGTAPSAGGEKGLAGGGIGGSSIDDDDTAGVGKGGGAAPTDADAQADITPNEAAILERTAPGAPTGHSAGSGEAPRTRERDDAVDTKPDDVAVVTSSATPPRHLLTLADGIMAQLKAKTEAPAMQAWLDEATATTSSDPSTTDSISISAEERLLVFAHCVLVHGRANFKNAATLFDRYAAILSSPQGLPGPHSAGALASRTPPPVDDDFRAHLLLLAVDQVWHAAPYVASVLQHTLMDAGLVTPAQVVTYALEPLFDDPAAARHFHPPHASGITDAVASSAGHRATHRLAASDASPTVWRLVHTTLERADALAHRAAVELNLLRGGRVFDTNEAELDVDVADAKEATLLQAATYAAQARDEGVAAAVACCIRVIRSLQAYAVSLSHGSASASASHLNDALEALRVTLSHFRDLARCHHERFRDGPVATAVTEALDSSAHSLTVFTGLAGVEAVTTQVPHEDLAAAVVHAARAYAPYAVSVPPALRRDADVPVPEVV